jgi:hypothetical protein
MPAAAHRLGWWVAQGAEAMDQKSTGETSSASEQPIADEAVELAARVSRLLRAGIRLVTGERRPPPAREGEPAPAPVSVR